MSWPSILVLVVAGITLYVGLYHLSIYVRQREQRKHLTFALTSLSVTLYAVFAAGLYSAHSTAQGVGWQRAQVSTLAVISIALLWFVADYTGQKPTRVLYIFTAYFTFAALVQALDRNNLTWMVDQPSIKQVRLPFDLEVTYYEVAPGPLTDLQSLVGMLALAYLLWQGIRYYRSGHRREATSLLVAVGTFAVSAINDTAVSSGLYHFIYTIEYGYLVIVLLMANSLASITIQASRMQEALLESEKRYRELVDNLPIGVYRTTPGPGGRFVMANPAFMSLLGIDSEERLRELVVADLYQNPGERASFSETMLRQGSVKGFELALKRLDGSKVWVAVTAKVVYEQDGTPAYFDCSIEDITQRKGAEEQLRQIKEFNENIIQSMTEGILIEDAEGYLTFANRAAAEMLGYTVEELIGRPSKDLVPPDQQAIIRQANQRRRQGKSDRYEVDLERKNGSRVTVLISGNPRFEKGYFTGTLAVFTNITERKQIENAEREQRTLAETLRDTAAALSQTLELEAVLEIVLNNVEKVVPHDAANIMLIESGVARIVSQQGYAERGLKEAVLGLRFPVAEIPNLQAMVESRRSQVIPDVRSYPGWVDMDAVRWLRSFVSAPICVQDEVIGFLNLDSATPGFFNEEHAKRLQAFADQAALAIRNARLYEAEQRRRHVAEMLHRAAAALNTSLELDQVLSLILENLQKVVDFDSASVQQVEDSNLVIVADQGFGEPNKLVGLSFPITPQLPNVRVVTEKKPLAIEDMTREYPHFILEADTYQSGHIRSWLGVPLLVRDQVIGMIALDRATVRPYSEEDIELASIFANQAAIVIENAQLYQGSRRRIEELEALRQVTLDITARFGLEELLRAAVQSAVDLLDAESGGVYLYRPDLDVLEWTVSVGPTAPPGIRLKRGEGLSGKVWESGHPIVVSDYASWEGRLPQYEKYNLGAVLGMPIRWSGELLGVLNVVVSRGTPRTFSEHDVRLIGLLADQLAIAIQNARLFDQVQRHAEELEQRVAERTAELQAAYEHLKELSKLKDQFVSNVSHELRTPIASLKVYHKLARSRPEKLMEYLEVMERETARLEHIVGDLLYLSRLDQGQVSVEAKSVDLNALAAQYVADRTPLAEGRGLTLTFKKEPNLPPVQADEKLTGQALSILLTNALNYTPTGGRIEVSTEARKVAGRLWSGFSVRDTGPGIPPEEMPRLFERFFRGQAALASGTPGTGLGLAIVKEIVDRHNGRVEVSSEPGRGATFRVWLPAEPAA